MNTDIQAAYNGVPSAQSIEEVLCSYPLVEAICVQELLTNYIS